MPNGNEGVGNKPVPYLLSNISISQLLKFVKNENFE